VSTGKRAHKKLARFPFFRTKLKVLRPLKNSLFLIAIIIFSIAVISSSATPVNITTSNQQAKLGMYLNSYFENANALFTNNVNVDTSTSAPTSSGSYIIPTGSSAYLWTTQFPTTKTIPTGRMSIDLWASSTPQLDGSASTGVGNLKSGSVLLTTSFSNDVIYASIIVKSTNSVPSISGAGLTWNLRGSVVESGRGATGSVFTFYAISASPLNNAVITATFSGKVNFVLTVFGISGADTATPFDSALNSCITNFGNNALATASVNLNLANDFIIGTAFINNNPNNITAPSPAIIISNTAAGGTMHGVTQYSNWENTGANTVSFTIKNNNSPQNQHWAIIVDAIAPSTKFSVSVFTTNSTGVTSSTLLASQTISVQSGILQASKAFDISTTNIPSQGYIKLVITPITSPISINWGNKSPSNFQIAFTYS
jgi:hypothetical protein